jgi:hypothetical protein
MTTTINPDTFNFDSIYAGLQSARKSHLTLCVTKTGEWACETSDAWLPNQLCRITANYSREGLERAIREEIKAANSARLDQEVG